MSKKRKKGRKGRKAGIWGARLGVSKAAVTAIRKAAARRGVTCPAGHFTPVLDARFCPSCQMPMSAEMIPPMSMIGKSASATEHWRRELAGSPDPELRTLFYRLLSGTDQNGGMAS
jgi:hypothetical protein